jgi:hypothetical protein
LESLKGRDIDVDRRIMLKLFLRNYGGCGPVSVCFRRGTDVWLLCERDNEPFFFFKRRRVPCYVGEQLLVTQEEVCSLALVSFSSALDVKVEI